MDQLTPLAHVIDLTPESAPFRNGSTYLGISIVELPLTLAARLGLADPPRQSIFLKPDLVKIYSNRGECKAELSLTDEARADVETALARARKTGDVDLASDLEQRLHEFGNA